jgi:dolichol-phosphate mannosyltransferase
VPVAASSLTACRQPCPIRTQAEVATVPDSSRGLTIAADNGKSSASAISIRPRASVIIPARDEAGQIEPTLDRLCAALPAGCEVLVVVDGPADSTRPTVLAYRRRAPQVRCLVSSYGPGPANAIRFGMDAARAAVTVVTMADGSDDPAQLRELIGLVEGGAAVASASRYMPGGRQLGGPRLKAALSRSAGLSLQLLARPGTRDATNSYKAYSAAFVRSVGVDSRHGFEVGIELTAKARRRRLPVAEVPTTWHGRDGGQSHFHPVRWLPRYLRWYCFSFGPALTSAQVRDRAAQGRP